MATKTCTSCRTVFRDRGQPQCPRCGASLGEELIAPPDAPDIEVSIDDEEAEPLPEATLSELSLMDPVHPASPVSLEQPVAPVDPVLSVVPVLPVVALGTCPTCRSNIPPGHRWCPVCRFNIVDPRIGKLASPMRRLAAYALDYLIPLFILMSGSSVGFLGNVDIPGISAIGGGVVAAILLAYVVVTIILFDRGTTPGKIVLGMWVVTESGARAGFWRMLCREWIGKVISAFAAGLGFIWILIDAENQGWHDMLVSTHVVQPAARP